MALGRVSLGEGINSNVGNCHVKLLRDRFSHLRENFESMCLPHSQWSPKLACSSGSYMGINWLGRNNCQGRMLSF